ncbi:MAG: class II aldolase/adducin family protein, partial [Spirochaetaceae bacterium]
KAILQAKDICKVDSNGECTSSGIKPSIETSIHMAVYRARPDVNAVVHAHPVFASTFCAVEAKINTRLTAEARVILGEPVKTPYALSGSKQLSHYVTAAVSCRSEAKNQTAAGICNVILMENHGVIALGSSLLEAFHRIEVLEDAAKMTLATHVMGNCRELSDSEIIELHKFFDK